MERVKKKSQVKEGDYCLFTKYSDRDPEDQWQVGFFSHFLDNPNDSLLFVPKDKQRSYFKCCWKISIQEGIRIVESSSPLPAPERGMYGPKGAVMGVEHNVLSQIKDENLKTIIFRLVTAFETENAEQKVNAALQLRQYANNNQDEGFEHIIEWYGVPACMGREVAHKGIHGVIVEDLGRHIGVRFDGEPGKIYPIDPGDDVEYGKIRKEMSHE